MSFQNLDSVLVPLAVIALILFRQLKVRPAGARYGLPLILGGLGVAMTLQFFAQGHRVGAADLVAGVVSIGVALAMAYPRARSMKIWWDGSQWLTRGTGLTIALWIVTIGFHVAASVIAGIVSGEPGMSPFDQVTMLIFVGVSLGAQQYFRGQHLTSRKVPVATGQVLAEPVR